MQLVQATGQDEPGTVLSLNSELRLPKREVVADVTFLYAMECPRACIFFLSYYSPQRHGQESLSEHLDSVNSFLPLRDKERGEFFIVHVNQLMMVREAPGPAAKAGHWLRLIMRTGHELALRTTESPHAWRARPLDLLNGPERFVGFIDRDHARVHVNKRCIVRVEEL
jgi:hypothetical protein